MFLVIWMLAHFKLVHCFTGSVHLSGFLEPELPEFNDSYDEAADATYEVGSEEESSDDSTSEQEAEEDEEDSDEEDEDSDGKLVHGK